MGFSLASTPSITDRFKPIWNKVLDGFGNHDPGKGRYEQQKSKWDTLHPGRAWARNLKQNAQNEQQISQLARDFLSGRQVPTIPTADAVTEET